MYEISSKTKSLKQKIIGKNEKFCGNLNSNLRTLAIG